MKQMRGGGCNTCGRAWGVGCTACGYATTGAGGACALQAAVQGGGRGGGRTAGSCAGGAGAPSVCGCEGRGGCN